MNALAIKALLALALSGALAGGYFGWHHHVYQQGFGAGQVKGRAEGEVTGIKKSDAVWTAREAVIASDVARKLANDTEVVRLVQRAADDSLARLRAKHESDLKNANDQLVILRGHLRDQSLRLSIPVAAGATAAYCRGAPAAGAGVGNTESRAELSVAAADVLTTLADDADNTARSLNQCIDSYNAVRASFNSANQ